MNKFFIKSLLCCTVVALFATNLAAQGKQDAVPDVEHSAQHLEGEAPLLERADLTATAAATPDQHVTVLVSLERADAVSSSTTVGRTFERNDQVQLQPVGSSNAIFVSGKANYVFEATKRLEALDAITPERRAFRRTSPSQSDAEDVPAESVSDLASGAGFLIVGTLGLIVAALLALRRWAS